MPIYDYTCGRCGHLTEVIHGIHEDGPKFCPACGAEGTMRKGFAAPAVHFKGSGWARKDRATAASKAAGRTAKPAEGDAGPSGGESKTGATSGPAVGSSGNTTASSGSTAGSSGSTAGGSGSANGGD